MVFLEAPQSAEEVLAVPGAVKAPALFNHVTRGKTPPVTLDQLRVAGYALVIMPGLNSGSAAHAIAGGAGPRGPRRPHIGRSGLPAGEVHGSWPRLLGGPARPLRNGGRVGHGRHTDREDPPQPLRWHPLQAGDIAVATSISRPSSTSSSATTDSATSLLVSATWLTSRRSARPSRTPPAEPASATTWGWSRSARPASPLAPATSAAGWVARRFHLHGVAGDGRGVGAPRRNSRHSRA